MKRVLCFWGGERSKKPWNTELPFSTLGPAYNEQEDVKEAVRSKRVFFVTEGFNTTVSDSDTKKSGFPPTLENLEKWDNFFQLGKSQGILNESGKSQRKLWFINENLIN